MNFEQESQRLTEEAARVAPEAVGTYLERIREKLGPESVITVKGLGYRIEKGGTSK